jgi:hypothetical protein
MTFRPQILRYKHPWIRNKCICIVNLIVANPIQLLSIKETSYCIGLLRTLPSKIIMYKFTSQEAPILGMFKNNEIFAHKFRVRIITKS